MNVRLKVLIVLFTRIWSNFEFKITPIFRKHAETLNGTTFQYKIIISRLWILSMLIKAGSDVGWMNEKSWFEVCLFPTTSRPALGATWPLIYWVPWDLPRNEGLDCRKLQLSSV
jgi:hypothetical protein